MTQSPSPNPLASVKALLFDVFGTVVDWEGSISQHLKHRVEKDRLRELARQRAGIGGSGADSPDPSAARGGRRDAVRVHEDLEGGVYEEDVGLVTLVEGGAGADWSMSRRREIARGAPGPTNVDALHREVRWAQL